MPISRDVRFKCVKCGYEEIRTIGDVLPDIEEFKPCPKCKSQMHSWYQNPDEGNKIIKNLKDILTSIKKIED